MADINTSIIIPVYNSEAYLEECLDSIFSQIKHNVEVIIVNDGSTDNSRQIINSKIKDYDNVMVIDKENRGLSAARNSGLAISHGEYIWFIDSDDRIEQNAIDRLYHSAKKEKLDLILFDAEIFGETDGIKNTYDRSYIYSDLNEPISGSKYIHDYFRRGSWPSACMVFLSKKMLMENNICFREGVLFEDNEFFCRICYAAERINYLPEKYYLRRIRKDSITTSPYSWKKALDSISNSLYIKNIDNGVKEFARIAYYSVLSTAKLIKNEHLELHSHQMEEYVSIVDEILADRFCNYEACTTALGFERFFPGSLEDSDDLPIRKDEILVGFFHTIGFDNRMMKLGIYGTGKNAGKIIDEYRRLYGEIEAELFFIETSPKVSGFMGWPVFSIDEIGNLKPDAVILSSPKSNPEMKRIIIEQYGLQYKVVEIEFVL